MNNRVIFLDMDGVLCAPRACIAHGQKGIYAYLDPVGIDFINRFCKSAKADVVVSSSWRKHYDEMSFKAILKAAGFTATFRKDWRTKDFGHFKEYNNNFIDKWPRPYEIEAWLSEHPDVKNYLIFDDDDFNWLEKQRKRWIYTHPDNGITYQNMIDACKKFQISINKLRD